MSRSEEVADSVRRILEDTVPGRQAPAPRFGDSIQENLELLREVLSQAPAVAKQRARRAAVAIENAITALSKDAPRDPAVSLGVLLAAHVVSQRLIEGNDHGSGRSSLVQLLS